MTGSMLVGFVAAAAAIWVGGYLHGRQTGRRDEEARHNRLVDAVEAHLQAEAVSGNLGGFPDPDLAELRAAYEQLAGCRITEREVS